MLRKNDALLHDHVDGSHVLPDDQCPPDDDADDKEQGHDHAPSTSAGRHHREQRCPLFNVRQRHRFRGDATGIGLLDDDRQSALLSHIVQAPKCEQDEVNERLAGAQVLVRLQR